MYKRIILASDCSRESLVALREGALLARAFGATVLLLIIEPRPAGVQVADAIHPLPHSSREADDLLTFGLQRLIRLGIDAQGDVLMGDPVRLIADQASRFRANLVVVGHRRQSLLERWWSGASGAYLVDTLKCSVLVARDIVSDADFERHLLASAV